MKEPDNQPEDDLTADDLLSPFGILENEDLHSIPMLPIRGNVVFPNILIPIAVSRSRSRKLLKEAKANGYMFAVITQRNDSERPTMEDLYEIGCFATVANIGKIPGFEDFVFLRCMGRFRLLSINSTSPYYTATVNVMPDEIGLDYRKKEVKDKVQRLISYFKVVAHNGMETPDATSLMQMDVDVVNLIASCSNLDVPQKQALLELPTTKKRLNSLLKILDTQIGESRLKDEIKKKTDELMDKQHREYVLNQQMKVIQDELGSSPVDEDVENLKKRAKKKKWSKASSEHFEKELTKLTRMQPQLADYSVQLSYLNFMLDLPWEEMSKDNLDISHARKVLDNDHYGIEKVKERILEYIAVLKLKQNMKSPILCLVGPPGTGKTSLGRSVADALGRKYVRMALGGLHDEAEIRGHRKTYVGALEGRILENIKKAGTSNPVFILDEIDKVTRDSFSGDPTSALLEVLDPEQNSAFHDNYLDFDYDLSNVMFIATANSLSTIQPALLDRMEVVELSGYILEEKEEIAKQYLIPKQLVNHGFKRNAIKFQPATIKAIINDYTRESGVRQLDKTIAKVIRRRAVDAAEKGDYRKTVAPEELRELLGLPLNLPELAAKSDRVGVVTGLAWTSVGGVILFIEASISKGKGTISMTGNLGEVMKESATLAFEYLKANAETFNVDIAKFEESNIHIHVPEGATPKDGPSAGITMFVAIVSAFTNSKVRANFAMTGEITLRGAVTPVGGIKEKILAAKRAGITDLILSNDNRRDVEDIPANYLQGLTFHYISTMADALPLVLVKES